MHRATGIFLAGSVLLCACSSIPAPSQASLGDESLDACVVSARCAAAHERCARGEAAACGILGLTYIASDPADGRNDVPLGASYVLRACRLNTSACDSVVDAASIVSCRGDDATATQLLRLACAEGYPLACALAADALLEGARVPRRQHDRLIVCPYHVQSEWRRIVFYKSR